MIFGFSQTLYEVPEEDSSGNDYVFEVCVELLSGEVDRKVVITMADEDGSAIGEHLLTSTIIEVCFLM